MGVSARTRLIRLLWLSGIGLCVLVFSLVLWSRRSEPGYQGKSLRQWLVPFCRETKKGLEAPAGPEHFQELEPVRAALRAMGTNALPYLISSLNQTESALHFKLRQLAAKQPYGAFRLEDPRVRRIRAIRGLAVLGPLAAPAVPGLERQLADPVLAPHALYALQAIGPAGVQAVVNQLTNASAAVRMQAGIALLSQPYGLPQSNASGQSNGQAPSVVIAGLSQMAKDTTSPLRLPALSRLMTMGPTAGEAASALVPLLQESNLMVRQEAIRALGRMHAASELVIPALTNALEDPDMGTRLAAFSALRAYGYKAGFPQPGIIDFGRPAEPFGRRTTNLFLPPRPLYAPPPPRGLRS